MWTTRIRALSLVLATVLVLARSAGAGDPSLLCWWTFEGNLTNSGSTGSANDGTGVGGPTYAVGQIGQALSLSGSGQYVNCGTLNLSTNGTGGISLCAWIKRPAAGIAGDHKIVGNRNGNAGFKMGVYNGGNSGNQPRLEMEVYDAAGQLLTRANSGTPLTSADTWYHVACVFDDTANEVREYVNGVLDTTTATTKSLVASTGTLRIGAEIPTANYYFNGLLDDVRIYSRPLSAGELQTVMKGGEAAGSASSPSPADKATDVPRDVVLGWTAGKYAGGHDVYFGTVVADVNAATRTSPQGVLVSQGQSDVTYDPAGVLDFSQTYYWRVDEVNKAPDNTIFQGAVWSFTTEPYAYPLQNVTATASSAQPGMGPEKTVDGSGLNTSDQHGTEGTQTWLSANGGPQPTWIQYQFDAAYKVDRLLVWNSNQTLEPIIGVGAKAVTVEYSADGSTWKKLGDFEFARAPGAAGYTANTTVDFGGVVAQFVKLTINSNWGGILAQYGLSEVRFFYVPTAARQPSPAPGARGVAPQVTLTWRAGREAASHQVWLGTDANNLAQAATVAQASYPADLKLGQTYYWQIVEANQAKDPATWPGPVWSFTTAPYRLVDDFESYTDKVGEEIFSTWIDGFTDGKSGSFVGNNPTAAQLAAGTGHFAETTIVHGDKQSMPLGYDNTGKFSFSEATRTFTPAQDWTTSGIKGLSLYFYGDPNNTGQLYLKINNTKIPYGGKPEDLQRAQWQPWNIDLTAGGANLKSVTTLVLGVEGASAKGILYFDDIRLYPTAGTMVKPVDPGTTGLVAWYKFDGDLKDSAGTHNGTAKGAAKTGADPVRGQVLVLGGVTDSVAVPLLGSGTALTISLWANTAVDPVPLQFESLFHCNGWEAGDLHWRYSYGKLNSGISGQVDLTGVSIAKVNQWNHVAVTLSPTQWALWLNGLQEAARTLTAPLTVTLGDGLIGAWLGTDGTTISRAFTGKIDEVRFYNRALSAEELAFLAGRTDPFYQPQ